jgi:Flp pilus assembly pilin Flp
MGFYMLKLVISFRDDEAAAAAAEYAIILAVVAIAVFVAAGTLGQNIATAIATAANNV